MDLENYNINGENVDETGVYVASLKNVVFWIEGSIPKAFFNPYIQYHGLNLKGKVL